MNPHPYVKRRGKYEHVAVAERALGHRIPTGAEVHHVNGNKRDNRPANLVLCESRAYHGLLHRRARALRECGHADWRFCTFCKAYDHPDRLVLRRTPQGGAAMAFHRECRRVSRILTGEYGDRGHPRARTHCPQGHPYDTDNTKLLVRKDGSRVRRCRECERVHSRANELRRKAARLQAADEKHAVKIANEVRAQMVTSGEWDSE